MRLDQLIWNSPGEKPEEAFLLGNGHFGVRAAFQPETDRMELFHSAFFSDGPGEQSGQVGSLVIETDLSGPVSGFERSLNLRDGIAACSFMAGETLHMRSVHAMEDPKVLCVHLSSTAPVHYLFSVSGDRLLRTGAAFDRIFFEGRAGAGEREGEQLLGMAFFMADQETQSSASALEVTSLEVMIFLAMETDYVMDPKELPGENWREILKKCLDVEIEKAVHGYLGGKVRENSCLAALSLPEAPKLSLAFAQSVHLVRSAFSSKSPIPCGSEGAWPETGAGKIPLEGMADRAKCLAAIGLRECTSPLFAYLYYRALPGEPILGGYSGYADAFGRMTQSEREALDIAKLLAYAPRESREAEALAGQANRETTGNLRYTDPLCAQLSRIPSMLDAGETQTAEDTLKAVLDTSLSPLMLLLSPGGTWQLDAHVLLLLAVLSFLVSQDGTRLHVLRALPKSWQSGELSGIHLCSLTLSRLLWQEGRLLACCLQGEAGSQITLCCQGKEKCYVFPEDGKLCLTGEDIYRE